jgi:uncharacterized membrane protein
MINYLISFILIIVVLLIPAVILKLQKTYKWMELFGSAFWCYLSGLLITYTPLLSAGTSKVAILMKISIPLALPLFVFAKASTSKDEYTKDIFKSFCYLFLAVFFSSILIGYLFRSTLEGVNYFSAMMGATYIGGTINMAALHQIFGLPEKDFLLLNTSDTIIGGIYLLLLLSIMPKFFSLILKRQKAFVPIEKIKCEIQYCKKDILMLLVYSIAIIILSYLPTMLFPAHWESMIFFSLLTLLAFLLSKKIPLPELSKAAQLEIIFYLFFVPALEHS